MRKITIIKGISALVTTLAFTAVNAEVTSKAQSGLVTIPSFAEGFEVNGSIIWLQPTSTSLDYGIHTQPAPIYNPNWIIQTINPDYDFGFDLGFGYIFPCSANDAQFSWAYLRENKSAANAVSGDHFVGPFFEIGPDAGSMKNMEGSNRFEYNRFNLDVGQFVYFGCRFETRLFTGLSAVFIKQHLTSIYGGDAGNPTFSMTLNHISKYAGLGPRFGIGSRYRFTDKIGFIAQIAGNAYLGRMRTALESVGTSRDLDPFGISQNPQSINADNTSRLVPSIEGKLGLDYCFTFNRCTDIKMEAGYQFANYFNAIRTVYPSTLASIMGNIGPIQSGGIFVGTMGQSQSDFAVNGPYLKALLRF